MLGGCARWFPAPVPMRSVAWPEPAAAPAAHPARCLVVFLPGMGDDAEDFERHGFVADMARRGLSVDMVAANATLGYYARGTFLQRLATDVVGPARARGYQQVWLIGNSMGGLGTVFYARAHLAEVTGVFALAPYLGDQELIREIDDEGGLAGWQGPPKVAVMNDDNYQRELWRWLQAVTRGQEPGPGHLPGLRHVRQARVRGPAARRGAAARPHVPDPRRARLEDLEVPVRPVPRRLGLRPQLPLSRAAWSQNAAAGASCRRVRAASSRRADEAADAMLNRWSTRPGTSSV